MSEEDCYNEKMIQECGCQFPEKFSSNEESKMFLASHDRLAIESKCRLEECPVECEQITYDFRKEHFSNTRITKNMGQSFQKDSMLHQTMRLKNSFGSLSFMKD